MADMHHKIFLRRTWHNFKIKIRLKNYEGRKKELEQTRFNCQVTFFIVKIKFWKAWKDFVDFAWLQVEPEFNSQGSTSLFMHIFGFSFHYIFWNAKMHEPIRDLFLIYFMRIFICTLLMGREKKTFYIF